MQGELSRGPLESLSHPRAKRNEGGERLAEGLRWASPKIALLEHHAPDRGQGLAGPYRQQHPRKMVSQTGASTIGREASREVQRCPAQHESSKGLLPPGSLRQMLQPASG